MSERGLLLENIVQFIKDFPNDNIPIFVLSRKIEVDCRTIVACACANELTKDSSNRLKYISKNEAIRLAERNRAKINGWKTVNECAEEYSVDKRKLKYLLEMGRIRGQKDLSNYWRVNPLDETNVGEKIGTLIEGIIDMDGTRFYSIAKAAKDAAALITKLGTSEYKEERNRLNKRFQRQVYETKIGQIILDGRYFVPEAVYKSMINPKTLEKGGRTDFRTRIGKLEKEVMPVSNKVINLTKKIKIGGDITEEPFLPKSKIGRFVFPIDLVYAEWRKPDYTIPPAPEPPPITIIRAEDYESKGIKIPESPTPQRYPTSNPRLSNGKNNSLLGPLQYDGENPPRAGDCFKGREIRYFGRTGVIRKVLTHDKFRPTIIAEFPYGDKVEKFELLLKR